MKKTIIVYPESRQHRAIEAIMQKMKFEEMERFVTGGLHCSERLVITYEGNTNNFDDKLYVEFDNGMNGNVRMLPTFVSLDAPDGFVCDDIEAFKLHIKKPVIEVKQFI